ncbi:hypothetical protein B0H14DRAFT_3705459 [Mycena olivaceomarginata]|nr:hypothetical protein B0H14DRAFT_3705459 [Mycena olivaceomarginata]
MVDQKAPPGTCTLVTPVSSSQNKTGKKSMISLFRHLPSPRTMTTDPNRHHTRAATREGIFPAPKLPRDTPSSPGSPAGAHRATGSLNSRPVTPELSYSDVVAASLSRGVSSVPVIGQDDDSGNASASVITELPSLTRDIDFGPVDSSVSIATCIIRMTHLLFTSRSPSTVTRATLEMSREALARRYEAMAREDMAKANRRVYKSALGRFA